MLVGTAAIGLSGLLILAIAARALGAEDYAGFGVFWSATFFVVAVLFGAQQESTRSVAQRGSTPRGANLLVFAVVLGGLSAAAVAVTSPVWRPTTLDGHDMIVAAVVVAGLAYSMTGVLAGALAGDARWNGYSAMLVAEGASRLLLVGVVIAVAGGASMLAWSVVAAYPVAIGAGLLSLRRRSLGLRVDDSLRQLVANAGKTMVAAASVAALVNGFPLLMSTFSRGASESLVGALTLSVMLTRAPLLVPLMAMQGLLIKRFSEAQTPLMSTVGRLVGVCVATSALLGLAAGLVGPVVLRSFFGPEFELQGRTLGLLVLSSGLIGALSVTSPALIACNRHGRNIVGWLAAVVVSMAVLALSPGALDVRVPASLLAGPALGVAVHLTMLRRSAAAATTEAGS